VTEKKLTSMASVSAGPKKVASFNPSVLLSRREGGRDTLFLSRVATGGKEVNEKKDWIQGNKDYSGKFIQSGAAPSGYRERVAQGPGSISEKEPKPGKEKGNTVRKV